MTHALETARAAYDSCRQWLLERLEASRPTDARQVPPPRETLAQLAALAVRTSRALFIEFFMLDRDDAVAFLAPTWCNQAPRPVPFRCPANGTNKFIIVNPQAGDRFYRLFKP
jgi:hypothetical protein